MRERPATPFAITTGEGCGVWYRSARRPSRSAVPAARSRRTARPALSVARPTSIRFRLCVDGIGPVPSSRSTSQCDGTHTFGSRPGDEVHVAAEVVCGAHVDEPSLDRRLAEEHRGDRSLAGERGDLRCDGRCSGPGRRSRRRSRRPGRCGLRARGRASRGRASDPASRAGLRAPPRAPRFRR